MKQTKLFLSCLIALTILLLSSCKTQLEIDAEKYIASLDTTKYEVISCFADDIRHSVYFIDKSEIGILHFHDIVSNKDDVSVTWFTYLDEVNYLGTYVGDSCIAMIATINNSEWDGDKEKTTMQAYDTYSKELLPAVDFVDAIIDAKNKTISGVVDSLSQDQLECYKYNRTYDFDGHILKSEFVGKETNFVNNEEDDLSYEDNYGYEPAKPQEHKTKRYAQYCKKCMDIKYSSSNYGGGFSGDCPSGNSHQWDFLGEVGNGVHKFYCNKCGLEINADKQYNLTGYCPNGNKHVWTQSY